MHKYRITGPDAEVVLNRLATRDVRIEAGFVVTGVEFSSTPKTIRRHRGRTPFESGMGHMVHFDKPHFNGRRALLQHQQNGPRYMLVGLDIEGDKPAKDAYVYHNRKKVAGQVNAAMWPPMLKSNIALAMLKAPYGIDVTEIYGSKSTPYRN